MLPLYKTKKNLKVMLENHTFSRVRVSKRASERGERDFFFFYLFRGVRDLVLNPTNLREET